MSDPSGHEGKKPFNAADFAEQPIGTIGRGQPDYILEAKVAGAKDAKQKNSRASGTVRSASKSDAGDFFIGTMNSFARQGANARAQQRQESADVYRALGKKDIANSEQTAADRLTTGARELPHATTTAGKLGEAVGDYGPGLMNLARLVRHLIKTPVQAPENQDSRPVSGTARQHIDYPPNAGGVKRSLPEALTIAETAGVDLDPERFHVTVDPTINYEETRAYYFKTPYKPEYHINELKGTNDRWFIRIHPNVLLSDQEIVGTLAHETYESDHLEDQFRMSGNRLTHTMVEELVKAPLGSLHQRAEAHETEVVNRYFKTGK